MAARREEQRRQRLDRLRAIESGLTKIQTGSNAIPTGRQCEGMSDIIRAVDALKDDLDGGD